ncbi:MAG: Na/Pi cotransporter family protein [Lachnospiraceae bacterium]|nr:Na/Pi cotransporter family protein [Lachnospiraceae bacterium]
MDISQIIQLFCGISLFLFGMSLMGDGLKKLSGDKLEPILHKLSNTRIKAVLLGTGVTAVIQSSCAIAVMVVGFVNSGMMKVAQAVNVILGAILGTSITGWILCLSYIEGGGSLKVLLSTSTLTGLVAVLGILLRMLSKKKGVQTTGDILLGFCVLMLGMKTMSEAVSGLGNSPQFVNALSTLSSPLIGILIGALFTVLLQSASAAVGILQALSVTGVMSFENTLPLLLGISIGAAAPVMLSSIGAEVSGKRTALIYPVSATLGVMFVASVFYTTDTIVHFEFRDTVMTPFNIALANTLLRLIMVLFLMPFSDIIESLAAMIITDKPGDEAETFHIHLEDRFLPYAALAIEQSRRTINEMAHASGKSLIRSLSLMDNYDENLYRKVYDAEDAVDKYETAIGNYLLRITQNDISASQNESIALFLHTLSDFERISDHALSLAKSAREIFEKEVRFSTDAGNELSELFRLMRSQARITTEAFTEADRYKAAQVGPLDNQIEALCDEMKSNHIRRLQEKKCTIQHGFIFNDIVNVCEQISDHCTHIAEAMTEE